MCVYASHAHACIPLSPEVLLVYNSVYLNSKIGLVSNVPYSIGPSVS